MLDLAAGGMVVLAGFVVVLLIALLISDRPPIGFALLSFAVVLNMDFPIWPTLVTVAGLSVTFADLTAATLALTALVSLMRESHRGSFSLGLPGMIAVLVLVSVVSGIIVHGLGTAVNEARSILLLIAVCLWIFALRPGRPSVRRWIEWWAIWTGVIVLARGLLVIATQGLNSAGSRVASSGGEFLVTGRPMASTQALLLAFAGFIALSIWRSTGKGRFAILSAAFFAMVILAQHRSVWLATVAGGVWYVASLDVARRFVTVVAAVVCGAVVLGLLSWIGGSSVVDVLTESATDSGTFEGRLYDWQVLVERSFAAGPTTVVFGFPFGEGWLRYRVDGLPMDYVPHNIFVSNYLRIGVVGLLAMVLLGALSLRRAARQRDCPTLGTLLVVVLVFCLAYNFTWLLAPILGLTIWGTGRPDSGSSLGAKFHSATRTPSAHPSTRSAVQH